MAILLQQTTKDTTVNAAYSDDDVGAYFGQTLTGSDVNGTVTSVKLWCCSGFGGFGAQGPADAKVVLNGTDSNTVEIPQGNSDVSLWTEITFTFSPGVTITSGNPTMLFQNVELDRLRWAGSAASTYAGGVSQDANGNLVNVDDANFKDAYFIMESTDAAASTFLPRRSLMGVG